MDEVRINVSKILLDQMYSIIAKAPATGLTYEQLTNFFNQVNADAKVIEKSPEIIDPE